MRTIIVAILLVLAIIFAVPIAVYGSFAAVTGLQTPGGEPFRFLLGVLVSKAGTAIAFVLIFHFARSALGGRGLLYASLWWLMFALGELGQAIGPDYSPQEAIAGIVSETIYLPLCALLVIRLIAPRELR
jgi:hypothetical protein